ncbi:helix-turn-helix domain-containing protein [Lentzea rhizosphaerae]|uniref:Helix-turn-helix domain-containing protein n=1 Tax=Lentzea rhizosphaerae TaxID=2041025 RepID=A0ABV8C3L2_9PSEU
MQSDECLDRVRALREQGHTPKEIARALGIKPSEASRLVRAAAILAQAEAPEPLLVGCWVSPNWNIGLTFDDRPDWPVQEDPQPGIDGLVSVLIARRHRHDKVSVCGYLADVFCLGVKNALGPEIMDELALREFVGQYFSSYNDDPLEAPVELARQLVFGSLDYARGLGFEPHPDFAAAAGHLGPWTPPSAITFGRDGKPIYVSGPYDNPQPIIRKLERAVGAGNFEFIASFG